MHVPSPAPSGPGSGGASLLSRISSAMPILIAVFSLVLTVYEARSARQSRLVSVWPRIGIAISDSAGHYTREVTNYGVGPALVRSMHVRVDDKPVSSWGAFMRALFPATPRVPLYYSSFGRGSVLLSGAHLSILSVSGAGLADSLALAEQRVRVTVCYCSLYEECWETKSDVSDPSPVARCSEADATEFSR